MSNYTDMLKNHLINCINQGEIIFMNGQAKADVDGVAHDELEITIKLPLGKLDELWTEARG